MTPETTGRLITGSSNWSTTNKRVEIWVNTFYQFVNSRPVATASNKLTSCPLTNVRINECPLHPNVIEFTWRVLMSEINPQCFCVDLFHLIESLQKGVSNQIVQDELKNLC